MRIRRSKPTNNYVLIPNGTARDERLSYLARGVLLEILSRPDGWETNADALSERARQHRGAKRGEGRRALREAFAELEAAGYMIRHKERDPKGRIVTLMEAYDTPQNRGTASGMSVPTCDDIQTPSSDRDTANGTSESHRGTANGTSATTSENTQTPSSDRRTANRPSVSGTSTRRTEDKDEAEEEKLASADAHHRTDDRPRIPATCQPLVDALFAEQLVVGWDLEPAEWFLVEALIKRCGIPALVISARASWQGARTTPRTGRYFFPGWRGIPDAPATTPAQYGAHTLPAVAGTGGNVLRLPTGQTLTGTDARVAGWLALADELAQENQ